MAGRFSVQAIIKAVDKFSAPIAKMESRFGRMTRGLAGGMRGMNRMTDKVIGGLGRIGIAATAAGAALGIVGKNVIDVGADFEQTMIGAAAKFSPAIRQGTAEFAALSKTAQDIGGATEFSASQAAAALKDLASAGFTSTQAIAALPGVVDLATASELELSEASEIASKSLGAFGLMTEDATQLTKNLSRVSDVMARTADATSASMAGLFESVKEAGPVSAAAGQSLETFMALAGQLSQSGIEASVAGTTLKNVFLSLSAPTAEAATMLRKLGVETVDAKGNMRDAIAILGDLETATAKMGTATKAGALETIFGRIPIAGVTALLDAGSQKLGALRTQLEGAGGATAKMAGIMRDSTQNELKNLDSAIEAVKISVFEVAKGPLRDVIKSFTDWTSANKGLIAAKVDTTIKAIADALPAVVDALERAGRAAVPILAVAAAVKGWALAQFLLNAAMAANPWTLLIIAVTAAAALIAAFWPEIKAGAAAAWQWISDKASAAWDGIKSVWDSAKQFFVGLFEFIVGAAKIILWPQLKLFELAAPLLMAAWEPIKAFFGALWDGIASAFGAAWEKVKAFAVAAYEAVTGVWAPISAFFANLWSSVADAFSSVLGGILDRVTSAVNAVRGIGRETLDTVAPETPSAQPRAAPQVIDSTGEKIARSIHEERSTTQHDIFLHDPKGRATVRSPKRSPVQLRTTPSGAF